LDRGDKPMGLKYIYTWKCHKKTPLCSLNRQKCHFFPLFFYKNGEQEGGIGPVGGGGEDQWKQEVVGKGIGG
jgi:hypothetical protein